MSNMIGEIYEINLNGKWELLKYYNETTETEVNDDDEVLYNGVEVKTGDKKNFKCVDYQLVDDYWYMNFLIDSGYIKNDDGMPLDVSSDATRVYDSIPNEPSIPSYFTLFELKQIFRKFLSESIDMIKNMVDEDYKGVFEKKVDWIIEKMIDPDTKPFNSSKDNGHGFWERIMEEKISDLMALQDVYTRISTIVDIAYPNYISDKDIRVIWFVY